MKHKCPICHKSINLADKKPKYFPFCSKRCNLIDLGTWLDADYKIISKIPDQQPEKKPDNDKT